MEQSLVAVGLLLETAHFAYVYVHVHVHVHGVRIRVRCRVRVRVAAAEAEAQGRAGRCIPAPRQRRRAPGAETALAWASLGERQAGSAETGPAHLRVSLLPKYV